MKNKWHKYRKPLFKKVREFYPWDFGFNLELLKESIIQTKKYIQYYSNEVDETRLPKIKEMERSINLLTHIINDNFFELAEKELGVEWQSETFKTKPVEENDKLIELIIDTSSEQEGVFKRIRNKENQLREQHLNDLFDILKRGIYEWWD